MAHPDQGACLDPAVCGCDHHKKRRRLADAYGGFMNTRITAKDIENVWRAMPKGDDYLDVAWPLHWNGAKPDYSGTCPQHPGEYGTGCAHCEANKVTAREDIASSKRDRGE